MNEYPPLEIPHKKISNSISCILTFRPTEVSPGAGLGNRFFCWKWDILVKLGKGFLNKLSEMENQYIKILKREHVYIISFCLHHLNSRSNCGWKINRTSWFWRQVTLWELLPTLMRDRFDVSTFSALNAYDLYCKCNAQFCSDYCVIGSLSDTKSS